MNKEIYFRYVSRYLINIHSTGISYTFKDVVLFSDEDTKIIFNTCGDDFEGERKGFLCITIIRKYADDLLRDCFDNQSIYQIDQMSYLKDKSLEQLYALSNLADEMMKIFRWRTDLPFSTEKRGEYIDIHWSIDQINWRKIPTNPEPGYTIGIFIGGNVNEVLDNELIYKLLSPAVKDQEPLWHSLILEALNLLESDSLRAAFAIGYTALEIGVKQYIQSKLPSTSWLVENSPSPDMVKICSKFLPTIDNRFNINKTVFIPLIKAYMESRNKLIHMGDFNEDLHTIMQKLYGVKYILHRLDYCLGFEHAQEYAERMRDWVGNDVLQPQ